ncbi:penicillin acylase family protein [Thiorhodococcus mannitoliphagus]|uniref:Penicillin acylase family protein n=1 Tax=Thiorhodococcus mannitoliphagus TaxID=329406 RepID=A0A6P1DLB3_9GAMM|nr:penicillin acylase family protein [Thiorhodococcus mannitoliphagus]NEX18808.1 penicillin acylase family protein [Thiorhodococcus mannitoliphagus]
MLRRVLAWTLSISLLLLVAAGGGVYWLGKRAEPVYQGSLPLAGLSAPVRVRFGPHAVPSIAADNLTDLMFAQGYVVASERLWQMDLMRRLASGQLAELFGQEVLPVDRFFRTFGLAAEARRSLEALEPLERSLLQAYAEGVNAYIEHSGGRLPLEYLIARLDPEPWQPVDSLAIGAYMAWTQSFNLRGELTFLRLAKRIGPRLARELFPVDEGLAAPAVEPELVSYLAERSSARIAGVDLERLDQLFSLPGRLGLPMQAPASNAWLVSGLKSATGAALLANDPHLAASTPSIWYELELTAPDLHVAGAALPGVPLVLIGHNQDLAWGITSVIADTQDVFIEQTTEDGAQVLRTGRAPEPIETRWESIAVRNGPPVRVAIRSTSRGVVLNDILGEVTGTQMDLPDAGLEDLLVLRQGHDLPDLGFRAVRRLSQARTLKEAMAAGLDLRHVAANLMLAHRDGGIAWQMTGLLPKRGKGTGAFPLPGWLDAYAWQGVMPQAMNPSYVDPVVGVLITANNRSTAPDYPVPVSNAWSSPHRAQRIAALLADTPGVRVEDMARIQGDRISLLACALRDALLELESEIRALDAEAWELVETYLRGWDGAMLAESRSAVVAEMLEPALFQALYGDELGEDLPALMSLAIVHYGPLQETLRTGESSFWDDVRTPALEQPAEIWVRALNSLAAAMAAAPSGAEAGELAALGNLRSVAFPHAFDSLPLIGRLFSVGPVSVGGSADTVDVIKGLPQDPWRGIFIASMRVVATPADWSQTRGTLPLGQSGHVFSPYRSDQLEDWLAVRGHAWPWNGPSPEGMIGELLLTPDD